jgi:DNA-binding CsgD family transcriptional regulator
MSRLSLVSDNKNTGVCASSGDDPKRLVGDLPGNLAEIGALIGSIGHPDFSAALDGLISATVAMDLSAIFAYPPEGHPVLLHDGIGTFGAAKAMDRYLCGTYLLDAVYQACADRWQQGLYRVSDFAPDAFLTSTYSIDPDIHPCLSLNSGTLAEELVYLVHLENGVIAAYSVMRRNGRSKFDEGEFQALKGVAPIVINAIARNWEGLNIEQANNGYAQWSRRGRLMEYGFETFAADVLSPRERLIVRLMLKGHSAYSISHVLAIADGTVKNHKKNIYFKMRISSQSELFAAFVRHVCR